MITYYFKNDHGWFVTQHTIDMDNKRYWKSNTVIKLRTDGSGQIVIGSRNNVDQFLLRKFMPVYVLAKDEMTMLMLSAEQHILNI